MKIFYIFAIIFFSSTSANTQVWQEWIRTYNGPLSASSTDIPVSVMRDRLGNIIVGGTTTNNLTNSDFYIIKYNSAGVKLWSKTFDTGLAVDDILVKITIDNSGNIFALGQYLLAKLNSNGGTEWFRTLPFEFRSVSMATDSAGNTFVLNDFLYRMIKYNTNGDTVWTANYNESGLDFSTAMVLDNSGEIYVTGSSDIGGVGNNDYLTVKFNSDGAPIWSKRYDGPSSYKDYPFAIALDISGNIYVTGASCQNPYDNYDIATIKYNSLGNEIWVRRYNGDGNVKDFGRDITTDNENGKLFVTGYSTGSNSGYDISTIKYDTNGVQEWVRNYNGVLNDTDRAYKLSLDNSGNICVTGQTKTSTGFDFITLKYGLAGNLLWTKSINGKGKGDDSGRDILIDNNSNVYVTGETFSEENDFDVTTEKYDFSGNTLWTHTENERLFSPSDEHANAMAFDSGKNIYVGGSNEGENLDDAILIKYSPIGERLWFRSYNGEANGNEIINTVSVDRSGNIVAAGYSSGMSTGLDILILKYKPNGDTIWVRRFNKNKISNELAYDLALDKFDNIFITGYTYNYNTITLKYDSAGIYQWSEVYNSSSHDDDGGHAIVVDDSSNCYVAGNSIRNLWVIKYDTKGTYKWAQGYNEWSEVNDIVIDDSSNVYVVGSVYGFFPLVPFSSVLTIKYNCDGVRKWVQGFGITGQECKGNSIMLDNSGYLAVTGRRNSDYATIKYDLNGSMIWNRTYNGLSAGVDIASSLTIDNENSIYVTGYSTVPNFGSDIVTIKYDSSGVEKWNLSYNGSGNNSDISKKILVDIDKNVYVCGDLFGNGTQFDLALIKYNQTVIGINNNASTLPQNYYLLQNYPNPFNPTTSIQFELNKAGHVTLIIYDVKGSKIKELVNEVLPSGRYENKFDGSNLSSGIYFYKMEITSDRTASKFSETKRMILLK